MAGELARRDLLRGKFKTPRPLIRPPYAIAEAVFLSLCQPCPDCFTACSYDLIVKDPSGRPEINFEQAECVFCGDCARACSTRALDKGNARPWLVIANISQDCLSRNGVVCRSCGDHCNAQAIGFKLMTGGRSSPLIDKDICTGCGACVPVCPNKSISMIEQEEPLNT